jgi:hypothetical protein
MPNHYVGDLLHTLAISGLSRVRTELFQLLIVPSLAPHPVQTNRQSPGHGYLGDPSFPSHGQVKKLTTQVGVRADHDLNRLYYALLRANSDSLGRSGFGASAVRR